MRNPFLVYGASGIFALVSVGIRWILNPILEEQSRFFMLLPVTFLCAIYGGVGPGTFACLLGGFLSLFLFVRPEGGTPGIGETKDSIGFVIFLAICAAVLWLTHREMAERRRRMGVEAKLEAANAELAAANADLEAKVSERTAALKAANDELEGFCYTVAHDLRTPSRAIAGNARILLEDYGEKLDPDLTSHLSRINNAALKLGALVDGLLTYARLAKQDIVMADVDLSRMAREVVETEARRAKIDYRLDVEDGIFIRADERQLRTLVRALAENSLIYRKPGMAAGIRVTKRNDGFTFEDEGIGFDMAYVDKVFMPFERLHRDEAYPGVGLGLANVERVVQRHGGRLEIESALDRGTSVKVHMAIVPAPPQKVAVGPRGS